jgi:D-alanine--poly(phosphoribitol) ligase subunit 1
MTLTGSRADLPAQPIAHQNFEVHAALHPGQIAVTCGADRRTYGELDASANQFARYLSSLGAGRGSIIGVCIDRSVDLMVAILGILKAGAAYVPLDPAYPRDRLRFMVAQLPQMKLIAVAGETLHLIGGDTGRTCLDLPSLAGQLSLLPVSRLPSAISGDDLCYAVFTSGSTGTPKATAVRHVGWYNLLNWLQIEYRLGPHSANLMLSSFGFDISQRSLMTPLFTGATLHLLPSRSFDIAMAYRLIRDLGVRTLHCAPSTLYLLVERETATRGQALAGLNYVFIGGEPLTARRVTDWARRDSNSCVLLHQYGVAECTHVASSHPMTDFDGYATGPVPVGRPVYNTEIHLLADDLTEVPAGETGEICISGTSVGAGYLNAAPTDYEKFVLVERDGETARMYRTGDRGYATPAGELVVIGRIDAQVKIRGMRIDLGDVEHAVRSHPDVRDVTVLALRAGDGDLALVAFYIPADGSTDKHALRRDLLDTLPRNMVPQDLVELAAFPLNPNGKVDRQALAEKVQMLAPSGVPGP